MDIEVRNTSKSSRPWEKRRLPIFVAGVLLIHAMLLARVANVNAPMFDEIAHLPSGLSHWQFGNFDLYRVNPPLMRMLSAIPLLFTSCKPDWSAMSDGPYDRPEFSVGREFIEANGQASFQWFRYARWSVIPVSMLGGWLCFCWAAELFGNSAGIVALLLWSFCPNVIGWGATLTPDLGAATFGIAATYTYWKWLRRPEWTSAFAAGGCLGLAELSKSSWIILFALWPMLWAYQRIVDGRRSAGGAPFAQLASILALGLYLLNLGYGFENSFQRLDQFNFISRSLGGTDAHATPGNRFHGAWIGKVPIPLPANYVRGIDVQKYDFERGKWSYLRGEQKHGGWYHYYIYALAVKTPTGTLALVILSIWLAFFRRLKETTLLDELVLLAPAVAILALVSSQTGFSRYMRYAIPALPFLFVFAARVGAVFDQKRKVLAMVCSLCIASSILEGLFVFPHSLSFFNYLAGGPIGGPKHLLDANIDWGQDLFELRRFLDEHPEAKPIGLAYFGYADPVAAGIDSFEAPKRSMVESLDWRKAGLRPGWYAVSVNHLYGYRHYDSDKPDFTYFQFFQPSAMAGYSIYIYQLSEDDIHQLEKSEGWKEPLGNPGSGLQR